MTTPRLGEAHLPAATAKMKLQLATVPAVGGRRPYKGEGTSLHDVTWRSGLPASATTGETSDGGDQRGK